MQRKLARILSLTLVLTLFIPILVLGQGMKDLEKSPYKKEIMKLIEDEVVSGYSDNTFRPEKNITRGEFSKMIANALKLKEDKEGGKAFKDVVGKWHQGYVGAVYKAGLMEGMGKGNFGADENITREQMIVVVIRGLGMEKLSQELKLEPEFKDSTKISFWAKDQVALAQKIGLLNGVDTLNPRGSADRQTVAKLTYELIYNREVYEKNFKTLVESGKDIDEKKPTDEKKPEQSGGGWVPPIVDEKPKEEKTHYEILVDKYIGELEDLETHYIGELLKLYNEGKKEYDSASDKAAVANKYKNKAKVLETEADKEVEAILLQMKQELNKYGYDTSIVDETRKAYEQKKDSARNYL